MAWTAPKTWLAAILSTADMNTHVRDNLLETVPAKASAAGQVPYANGVNSIAMLAAVARRMPRFNAAGNALETVANISLAQAPLFTNVTTQNLSTAYADVITLAVTTTGGMVMIWGSLRGVESKSADAVPIHDARLRRDTTDLGPVHSHQLGEQITNPYRSHFSFLWRETPAAGAYTYRLQMQYNNANTSGTPTADAELMIMELAP